LREQFFRTLLGRTLRVLVEAPSETRANHLVGTSCRYAPVELAGRSDACGRLVDVIAEQVVDGQWIRSAGTDP
jgi:tRNA A37 methylthiotransferase MiaB